MHGATMIPVKSMYWTTQKEAFNICSYYDSILSVSSNKSGPCPYIPCVSFASTKADGQIARPSLLICFAFDDKEGHRRIIPDNKSNPASFLLPPFGVLLCATTECLRRKGNAPAKW